VPKKSTRTPTRARVPDLPHERRARWHLLLAVVALRAAHDEHQGSRGDATTLAAAGDVVARTLRALDEKTGDAREALLKMAGYPGPRRKVGKADTDRFVLAALEESAPSPPALKANFSFVELGEREGLRNVARSVMFMLASGAHRDAARLRQRWGVASVDHALASGAFADDVERLASSVFEIIETPSRVDLPRRIIVAAYAVLKLRKPLDHESAKRRRTG
jgi:hypothetical protein